MASPDREETMRDISKKPTTIVRRNNKLNVWCIRVITCYAVKTIDNHLAFVVGSYATFDVEEKQPGSAE